MRSEGAPVPSLRTHDERPVYVPRQIFFAILASKGGLLFEGKLEDQREGVRNAMNLKERLCVQFNAVRARICAV